MNHRRLKCALLGGAGALALLVCAAAGASSDTPDSVYVFWSAPETALPRYQAGALGVVQPSYDPAYLYVAWRDTALGARELKAAPNPADGLLRAAGDNRGGWRSVTVGKRLYAAWRGARASALKRAPDAAGDPANTGDLRCPDASYVFATSTLTALARRPDATPARLKAWVDSQEFVFASCGDGARAGDGLESPQVAMPLPSLPMGEALYWRQMHDYQMGATAFYTHDYPSSEVLFGQMGATKDHPLRLWGEYLALRSMSRRVLTPLTDPAPSADIVIDDEEIAHLRAAAEHILRDPSLAPLHEATRAILRSARALLEPDQRFIELSKLLDEPRADPYRDDRLGDWRALARQFFKKNNGMGIEEPALRKDYGFIDWLRTMHACGSSAGDCAAERQHALERWRHFAGAGAKGEPLARAWLLAAVTLNPALPADAEKAALRVDAQAPEYMSLRYRLTAYYRSAGQQDKARAIADAMLAGPVLAQAASIGASNLFLRERFALSGAPNEAANYLLRRIALDHDPDTGEVAAAGAPDDDANEEPKIPAAPDPAEDGLRWLNVGLSNADLLALADHPKLPATLRANLAVAAWMRADLIDQTELALRAAAKAGELAPSLAALMRSYASAAPAQRRHVMLLGALRFGLSPTVESNRYQTAAGPRQQGASDILARRWCYLGTHAIASEFQGDYDDFRNLGPLKNKSGVLPDTDQGRGQDGRDADMAQLGKLKTSTGYIGDHALHLAATTPNDPDLPWLLHVVVQSTKNGCLDDDAHALSKAAFTVLHTRYKNNEWTRRTPYYF